jgi:hypothetical protein
LAIALTFVFPRFSHEDKLTPAVDYCANNMAVRKSFCESMPFPVGLPLYRGQNVVHANQLRESQHEIWREPRARALHALPEPSHLIPRFLLFGRDMVTLARLAGDRSGRLYRRGAAPSPKLIGRTRHFVERARSIFAEDPRRLVYAPLALPIVLVCVLSFLAGMAEGYARLAPQETVSNPL